MSAPAPKKIRLDPFQSRCIEAVDAGESVMCSAHTSAGKTVVALHAIAKSLAAGQRVVYTSPIKALSNQKYRELQQIFEDVGLMTGETSVDADASCLVMTTEILRNMLYKGHELVREVQWVIFDEVHYMRDKERGVIWEECIILLPHAVRFVFLSATVPNGVEFARWVAHLHGRRCHLVTTQYRPTPLQHWALPAGGEGLHLVLDESGTFHPASLAAAAEQLQRSAAAQVGSRSSPDLKRLLTLLEREGLEPAIVFTFSRRECEGAAMAARSLATLPDEQLTAVRTIFDAAVSTLSAEDQQLPQLAKMLPLLERGVAVHHSGLLTVLKEVVEILFQEGLVKVRFATNAWASRDCAAAAGAYPSPRHRAIGVPRDTPHSDAPCISRDRCSSPPKPLRWASTCRRARSSSPASASGTAPRTATRRLPSIYR